VQQRITKFISNNDKERLLLVLISSKWMVACLTFSVASLAIGAGLVLNRQDFCKRTLLPVWFFFRQIGRQQKANLDFGHSSFARSG